MHCPVCSLTNEPSRNFCGGCGAQLMRHCIACGHREGIGHAYCGACGATLPDVGLRAQTAPLAYTPADLANEIDATRIVFEGARKLVTVMFADIVGATKLVEGKDPEIAYQAIDQALAVMLDAIHQARGFVARIQGDGLMALFGAPLAQEHHALRACHAALAIQANERLRHERIRIRIGLNTGEVVLRTIRNDLSVDYDAAGSTVHLASRMEAMAAPGGILITESTQRLVQGFVVTDSLGLTPVPGFGSKFQVYEVTARRQVKTRWEATGAGRALSIFVGRERELGLLGGALAAVQRGHGHVIHIVGDAGVGKSRLVHEFLKTLQTSGDEVQVTGAVRETQSMPYRPITLMLRDWAGIIDGDDHDAAVAKLQSALTCACPHFDADWTALRALLGLSPGSDERWADLDPQLRRRRMLDAVRDLMVARGRWRPQVMIVEDAHWLDRETLAALENIATSLERAAILLIVTTRHTQGPISKWEADATTILLKPLGRDGAQTLLRHMLGDDPSLTHLKWRLLADTEGMPMFLEQMVEDLAEQGFLHGEPGAYRSAGSLNHLRIPASVHNVIAARIDRLPKDDGRVLQVAAVIGRTFSQDLVAQISGKGPDAVERAMAVLRNTGFLEESADGAGRFCFSHALVQEVAYSGLLKKHRQELHARVVALLEQKHELDGGTHVETLARQACLGGLWQKAVTFARDAGAKANTHSAYHEAAHFFEMALEAACQLEDDADTQRCRAEINIALSTTYPPLGEINEGYAALKRAETLYESLGELDEHLEIGIYETAYSSVRGTLERACKTGEDVLKRAQRLKRPALVVAAKIYLAEAALFAGDFRRVVALIEPHLGAIRGPLRRRRIGTTATISIDGLGLLAMAYAQLGRFDEALALGAEGARIADEELCRPFDQGLAHFYYGFARTHRGLFDDAMESLERAASACDRGDVFMLKPWLDGLIAFSHARCGRHRLARTLFERSISRAQQLQLVVFEAMATAGLAVAVFMDQRLAEAEDLAHKALRLAEDNGYRGVEMWLNRVLGLIGVAEGGSGWERGEQRFLRALAIGQELGMKPDIALCRLFLGRHYAVCGRKDEAVRQLKESEALLRDMKMDFWLPHVREVVGDGRPSDAGVSAETQVA